ncbi:RICIN domain-containing protein [Bifidobacterium callimiconis]|uniref:RICIN domain-containing protein n=1 Tax=Bifidobacterium callimiconis TaxID=2306973 RepID=UPI0013DFA4DA|nr:RICIN domain-containing protein [Bifidobacterium callimiconis]
MAATAMLMPVGAAVAAPADDSTVAGGVTSVASAANSAQTSSFASQSDSGAASTVTDTSVDGPAKVEKTHVPQTAEESFVSASDASTYGLDAQSDEGDESGDAQADGAQPNGSNGSEGDSSKSDGLADGTGANALIAAADLNGLATVGVTWKQQDMTDTAKAPKLELRYFKDNAWSEWQTLPSVDDDLGKMGSSPAYYVGLATEAEARLTPVDGQTITEAKFITVDPGYSAEGTAKTSADTSANTNSSNVNNGDKSADSAAAVVSSSATESATTVDNAENSVDSNTASATAQLQTTEAASAASTSATTPSVRTAADAITSAGRIHTREEWWQSGNPARQWKPDNSGHWQGAVVHHTYQPANNYTQAEVPALINGIYVYHNTSNGWGDIGYNLLVDKYGGIWEGRDEGVDNQVVPASEAIGAHSRGFNSATFGVVVLGDFTTQAPSEAAINSVSAAIAWEFNALGITNAKDTFEYKGTQPRITGHGDKSHQSDSANNTACPGQKMWDRMDDIRNKVQKLLVPQIDTLAKVTIPDGVYYINAKSRDSAGLDVPDYSTADGTQLQLYSYNNSTAQRFKFAKQSDGSYVITNVNSGKALDVANGSASNGAKVQQFTPNGSAAQRWFIRNSGTGYYLQSALGNWVLDITGGNTSDRTKIDLYTPNGTDAQKFLIASATKTITTKAVKIQSVAAASGKSGTSRVIDVSGGSGSNGARLQIYDDNGTDAQLFRFKQVGNGVYTITNVNSGRVIDVANGSTGNGSTIQQWDSNGSAAQHWLVRTAEGADGTTDVAGSSSAFSLIGSGSNRAIDLPGGATTSGTGLQIYAANGTAAQQWTIAEAPTSRDKLNTLAAQHKDDIKDGTYKVSTKLKDSAVLDVTGASSDNGANVQLYGSNGTAAQTWTVSHDDNGYVTFTNANSGKVLDVSGGTANSGVNVQQYDSNGTTAQKWVVIKQSDGSYAIRSAANAKDEIVLDVTGASSTNGTNVQVYSSNNSKAQRWTFTAVQTARTRLNALAAAHKSDVADGTVEIASTAKKTMRFDVVGGSRDNGANVQLYASNGTNAQAWKVSHDSLGYVTLTNMNSGRVLDISGASTANGANVQQWDSNGSWAQKWIAVKNSDGSITLRSALKENFVIDAAGGAIGNGTNIQMWTSNDSTAQRWTFNRK